MARARRRAESRGAGARSRRTPVRVQGAGGRSIPWIPLSVIVGIVAAAGLVVYLIIQSNQSGEASTKWKDYEADLGVGWPGEHVDLQGLYDGWYGNPDGKNTNSHVSQPVDYTQQGVPPVGGPHWGESGSCADHLADASPFCGPVQWGIYRAADADFWDEESLVHSMEHGGVVVWYNTNNQQIIDDLENTVKDRLEDGKLVVLVPYDKLPADTIAMTAWARRATLPLADFTPDKVTEFINFFSRKFNPEGF